MLRSKVKKTFAGALSLTVALGTALSSVSVLPVLADETLPDPALIPKPVESEFGEGKYTLKPCSRIVVETEIEEDEQALLTTADLLAARLRKSTGYKLPVSNGGSTTGDIVLKTSEAKAELEDEGYTLTANESGVVIEAYEPAGVYNGTQTLRQMFPAEIEKQDVVEGTAWVVKEASIKDKPEYSYRGMHLDVARHFFTVEQVKRQIDLISQFKINKLHLHLSDDQGWRLEIKGEMYGESLDKLNTIGASTSCSTNGYRPGQYTQEDFKELVRYAADHNVEIIPEFDMPAHAWAALVSLSFLNSTEDGKPHAGSYDNTKPYDGWDVGWASLETDNEKTYEFIEEVVKQVAAISPSPIIHLGGDEAHSTSTEDYNYFCSRIVAIGKKYGKTVMGWQNLDKTLTDENKDDAIVQFWSTGNAKMMSGIKYIASPADHAYMDMKYDSGSEFGLTWATMNPVDDSYNWEPTNYGTRDQILGVEACLWSETLASDYALDYMIYPRIAGHAEVGWTAPNSRTWSEYKGRIAQYYDRFINEGIELRRDESVWPTPYEPVNATFSFEEGEGTTVTDNAGKQTGTFNGNMQWVDGYKGKGVYFDGSSCIDLDYKKDLQGAWTASMWLKAEATPGDNSVLLSGVKGEIKLDQWNKTGKVGLTEFGVDDYTYDYSAPLNEWVFLTFVCDESSTVLYANGERIGSISHAIPGPFSRIGHCAKSGMKSTGFMKGTLDEVSIFNEAKTPEEVAALYASYNSDAADFTALNALIEEASALIEEDYTADSWTAFASALEAARKVAATEGASQADVDAAVEALTNTMNALVDKPEEPGTDLSRIRALLHEAILYADTVKGSESFSKLAPAVQNLINSTYDAAVEVYNDETATFDEIATAWRNLTDAIHYAGFYADKSDLKNKIDEAAAIDLSGYTEESAAALRAALEAAQAVYDDENALQERIDKALTDLTAAMAGLTERPSDVDKSLLKVLLDEAAAALAEESAYIHDDAWTAFVSANTAAKAVYDNNAATAEDVADAIDSLGSAFLGIRKAPDEELLKALQEFVTLAASINRSLYSAAALQQIDDAVLQCSNMLSAEQFDNVAAAKAVEEIVEPLKALINETENNNKPEDPSKPSVKPGDNKPSDDKKTDNTDKSTAKPSGNKNSVKTAAALGAGAWMMTAAGAAVVAALNKKRK